MSASLGVEGVEPTRAEAHGLLKTARLPFRHTPLNTFERTRTSNSLGKNQILCQIELRRRSFLCHCYDTLSLMSQYQSPSTRNGLPSTMRTNCKYRIFRDEGYHLLNRKWVKASTSIGDIRKHCTLIGGVKPTKSEFKPEPQRILEL